MYHMSPETTANRGSAIVLTCEPAGPCVTHLFRAPFFLTNPPPTETYTLSLHDALPIYPAARVEGGDLDPSRGAGDRDRRVDRKSTRLNSSHPSISYAVFCLKKKNLRVLRRVSHRRAGEFPQEVYLPSAYFLHLVVSYIG